MVILRALMLGLSSGLSCLGHCFPVLAPLLLSQKQSSRGWSARLLLLFLLGRLTAYCLFGLLTGLLGRQIGTLPIIRSYVLPSLMLLLGLLMVLYGITQGFPRLKWCRVPSRYIQGPWLLLIVGFLTGIDLCPPFLLSLSYALTLGEVSQALIFYLFFFLATSLYVLPFLLSPLLSRFTDLRTAARGAAVIAGLWFAYLAVRKLL
jgi:sulfite exporter TauE/SafE